MTSEELLVCDDFQNQTQAPAPPTTLPPYPEMIISIIKALNEANGSNKSAISRHIEATYETLPPALLAHHLNKLRSTGQLQFIKNNYLIPDPTFPPRRGRGRPPKPKAPLPSVPLSPRPRGRLLKSRDPTSSLPVLGKKRGRPAKAATPATAAAEGDNRRGRGRPPKVTAPVGA